jgi:hypothetical protein
MAKKEQISIDPIVLEERKVKALEKIGTCLDALTLWFEEIDKDTWGPRLEWYLDLTRRKYLSDVEESDVEETEE